MMKKLALALAFLTALSVSFAGAAWFPQFTGDVVNSGPGQIALTIVNGAVTAAKMAAGAAASNLGFTPQQVFNIADYGAKCDGTTNDNTAINNAVAAAASSAAYAASAGVAIVGPANASQTGCVINSINLTAFTKGASGGAAPNARVELSNMSLICKGAGNICVDALGAQHIHMHDFGIIGNSASRPEICIQVGEATVSASSAWHDFTKANCTGWFTFTALYNVTSEANFYNHDFFVNLHTTSGPIWSLGAITGGSGYTNNTYTDIPLTGGSCATSATIASCARATIVVSGGAVTSVTLTYQGRDYVVADSLSAAAVSIGGTGSGFSVPVASIRNYAVVIDGGNHWRCASAFVTCTPPVDAASNATLNTFVDANMRGSSGGLWIGGGGRPTFINSYVVTGASSCVDIYSNTSSKWGYNLGLNCEGGPTNTFFFYGPTTTPSYPNFAWTGYSTATGANLAMDSNLSGVTLPGAAIVLDHNLSTRIPVFSNSPAWTVSGFATVADALEWNSPSSSSNVSVTAGTNQGPVLPLDILTTGVKLAISCSRLLAHTYNGPLCKMERASDTTTLDIYPDAAGNLDRGAFQAFCANTTCSVDTAYDQSGNGLQCVNHTLANQPVMALSVSGLNYRAAMTWATGAALNCSANALLADLFGSGAYALSTVLQSSNSSPNRLAYKYNGSAGWDWRVTATATSPYMTFFQAAATTSGQWDYLTPIATSAHVYDLSYSTASLANVPTLAIDGAALSLSATQPVGSISTDTSNVLLIGNNALTGGTRGFIGSIAEFMIWKTTPTAVQIEALRRNEGAYFGVAAQ